MEALVGWVGVTDVKMQALSLGMKGGGSGSALAYQKEGRRPHVYCMQKSQSRAAMAAVESVVSQLLYTVVCEIDREISVYRIL